MRSIFVKAAVLAASVVAASAAFVMPAAADPPGVGAACGINSVGSDTLQYVDNDLANGYNSANPSSPTWCSWDATGPSPITLNPGCTIVRPNGSNEGITALKNYPNCVDFARSTRGPLPSDVDPVTGLPLLFVRYLQDTLRYALSGTTPTHGSLNLSAAQLKTIYITQGITWNQVDSSNPSTAAIVPMLPQAGSGTLSFFLNSIGVTETQLRPDIVFVQENDPAPIQANADAIAPFSQARFNTLPAPKAIQLDTVPAGYSASYFGYHVVRNAGTAAVQVIPAYLQSILGNNDPTGYLCNGGSNIITQNAFDLLSPIDCGTI